MNTLIRFTVLSLTLLGSALAGVGANAQTAGLDLSAYKGKVVYIDFWASWCGPCRQSFPWMNELHRQKADDGLVILAVNLDQERELADQFINELNPAFNILFDGSGVLATEFKVTAMPSAFIVGRDGKVRIKHLGFHKEKRLQYEQEIQQLLDEPAAVSLSTLDNNAH